MIIDTHVHIGSMLGFELSEEDVIDSMERCGISHSIVSSLNAAEFDHHLKPVPKKYQHSQIECLDDVLRFAKQYPRKISAAVWVKPYGEKADFSLYNAVDKNRKYIKAIKFHPYHSNEPFDSDKTIPFIELARHCGLPAVIHTGGSDAASCIRVYKMAKRYPDVDFVMVHMGLGTDNSEAIELVSKLPNLYGDTTWVPVKSTLELIRKAGAEKIVFGSDNPIDGRNTYLCNKEGKRSLYQEYFNEFRTMVSETDYELIMHQNAERIFKINPSDIEN